MRFQIAANGCRRLLLIAACFSLLLTAPAAPAAQQRQCLCPVADAPGVASLERFRDELRAAVRARDLEAFRSLVASDVAIADDERGFAALVEVYELTDSRSVYWADLEHALAIGGVLDPDGVYCAPIVSCPGPSRWEPEDPGLDEGPAMSMRIAHRDGRWLLVRLSAD